MLDRMWNRSREESGLTLIELLIVIIIFSIMFLIAMPAYLSFRVRANKAAAQSNLRNSVPGLIQWNGEHTDGYASVTMTKLKLSYNISISNVSIFWPATTTYCLKSKVGTEVWYKGGPSGDFTATKPAVICP
jgi:prepilin-type N-terminal cleavage/methylation domain-containing protein